MLPRAAVANDKNKARGNSGPLTICFLNRKGGVGKTSTTFHVSGALAKQGHRVLLVDMDPQSSLTQGLLGVREALALPAARTVAGLFDDRLDPDPAAILVSTRHKNIWLAPACTLLNDYNLPRPEKYPNLQFALRDFLQEVRGRFDMVLIDCPPNLNLCSFCALLAADHVIIPLQAEDYGAQGIVHVLQMIDMARAEQNPGLRLMGYVLTMVGRLSIQDAYRKQLRELYGSQVFAASLPYLKDFKESISYGLPVGNYRPGSPAAKAVQELAREILERAKTAAGEPPGGASLKENIA
jgi:chromosome partitioning protein